MKRVKAEITAEVIVNYFSGLEKSIDGVPEENIINYDETNISDDPGKTKVFAKRGSKHVRRIMDSSKSSVSVMFAVAGNGIILPPYVVYQAKHLYPEWLQNGPDGTRYNRSSSGWFDADIYEDWFFHIALPYLRRKSGKKLLIGDNLSSHLSFKIITACEQNNIAFVFLPTNATHICQPLDVSVYGPLKRAWRKILTTWKTTNKGVVPKVEFPTLLRKLLIALEPTLVKNIKAGFECTGIIPLNPEKVIQKLIPKGKTQNDGVLLETFNDIMKQQTTATERKPIRRTRKINVPAGQSVSLADFCVSGESQQLEVEDETEEIEVNEEGVSFSDDENAEPVIADLKTPVMKNLENLAINKFVITSFTYNAGTKKQCSKEFLAKIVNFDKVKQFIEVSCLRNYKEKKNCFVFPPIKDICTVSLQQIKFVISEPIVCRGIHTFAGDL